jgi:hypothetical protein
VRNLASPPRGLRANALLLPCDLCWCPDDDGAAHFPDGDEAGRRGRSRAGAGGKLGLGGSWGWGGAWVRGELGPWGSWG